MKVEVDTLTFTKDDNGAQQSFVVDCNCPWQLDYDKENKKFSISVESSVIKVSTTGNNTTEQTNTLDLQIIPDETVPNAKSQTVHVVQKGIETKSVPSPRDSAFMKRLDGIMQKNISNADFGVEPLCAEIGMSRVQLYRIRFRSAFTVPWYTSNR